MAIIDAEENEIREQQDSCTLKDKKRE